MRPNPALETLRTVMHQRPQPDPIVGGQESVWNYPRPPRLEVITNHIRVVFGGEVVAETRRAFRVLETSHPPNYYLPLECFAEGAAVMGDGTSFCEWKGRASYYTIRGGDASAINAAWTYETPSPAFAALRGHLALYAHAVDACFVDGELVVPQPRRLLRWVDYVQHQRAIQRRSRLAGLVKRLLQ
jgi:uncharacterized protein (DUF427 family)